jgi:hypothetical protein
MYYLITMVCWCLAIALNAQDDPCKYSSDKDVPAPIGTRDSIRFSKNFKQELSTNFSRNVPLPDHPPFYLLSLASMLTYKLERENKGKTSIFSIFDELGWLFISDSISVKNRDLTRVKLEHNAAKTSNATTMLLALIAESQKFPSYKVSYAIPKSSDRIIESAFMSPGVFLVSVGFTKKLAEIYKLDFGLGACKFTWIARKDLFTLIQIADQNSDTKHKRMQVEGGLSFQASVDKSLGHHLNWQNNTLLFADLNNLKIPDLELRNSLSWSPTKILKTSLQTVIFYNKDKFPSCSWKGEFVIGVMLEKVN